VSTGIPVEPGSREPGLDQLIRALTADGDPHELAGRDAALAAFRTAHSQPRRRPGLTFLPGGTARLSAVAAALVAAFAGLTAAAYAKALPAPMQHIAHSMLSGVGVPDSQPAPAKNHLAPTPGGASHPGAGAGASASPHATPSPTGSCPCPTPTTHHVLKGSALTVTTARLQLPANGWDQVSGRLTYHGHPEAGVRIRLLEQRAGSGGWVLAGSGVTGGHGWVRVGVPHVTRNVTFRLAGANGVRSASVSVTVIPHASLWRAAPAEAGTFRLVAQSRFGDPGDTVVLQERSGGSWQDVATATLGPDHRASFDLPASQSGHSYRAQLQATSAHGASLSAPVFVPHIKAIGAKVVDPYPTMPHPGVPGHRGGHHHRVTGPVTPGPVVSGTPSPGPIIPGPVVPGPIVPGPVGGPVRP
jgi:hypothetical protein